MRSKFWALPLFALALAALACSAVPAGTVLFKDDFSDSSGEWKYTDHATVDNGRLVVQIDKAKTLVWTAIGEAGLANVHVEVSAQNSGPATDDVFGLVCGYQDTDNFYFLGIGTDGYYLIEKYEKNVETLLVDGTSDQLSQDPGATYRLGADCRAGSLTLYADGQSVATADDTAFAKGDVGLFVSSYKKPNAATSFDDFVVTALP